MTVPEGEARPAVYELTIAGPVGPVLRSALVPCSVAPSRECTILRAAVVPGRDLVELVGQLHRRGLEVEGAFEARRAQRDLPSPGDGA